MSSIQAGRRDATSFGAAVERAAASEENVGSVSSPLNVASRDRQPAAVALRGVRTTVNGAPTYRKDLYVFICVSGHPKRRIAEQHGGGARNRALAKPRFARVETA
jgi:hypothetical protein